MRMDEEHVEVHTASRPTFAREQKFGYAVVIICGVLAVALGMFYMVKHVKAPFIVSYTGSRFLTGEESKAAEIEQQRATDTDGDTVNDYDELNIYGSSPYLLDTDSDGVADNIEIASNGDPTCATDAACDDENDQINANTSISDGVIGTSAQDAANAAAQLAQIKTLLQGQSAEDIRAMLVDGGADATQVAAMSDEDIKSMYSDVLTQLEGTGELATLLQQVQAQTGATDTSTTTTTP